MKLSRNKMLLVSFMLFSLFFGAGNLIFPPFLGPEAIPCRPCWAFWPRRWCCRCWVW
jgi:branched-subunit amino acid permease